MLLSLRKQSENATYCMIPTTWYPEIGKTTETVKTSMVTKD